MRSRNLFGSVSVAVRSGASLLAALGSLLVALGFSCELLVLSWWLGAFLGGTWISPGDLWSAPTLGLWQLPNAFKRLPGVSLGGWPLLGLCCASLGRSLGAGLAVWEQVSECVELLTLLCRSVSQPVCPLGCRRVPLHLPNRTPGCRPVGSLLSLRSVGS